MDMSLVKMALFVLSIFCVDGVGLSKSLNVSVIFNSIKFGGQLNITLVKDSFHGVSEILTKTDMQFLYMDMNSSYCNIEKFLSLLENGPTHFHLLVLMDDCSCEKKLSQLVHLLHVKFVSHCDRSVLTAKGTSAILEHTEQNRMNYLVVPPNAIGLEFYEQLSNKLQNTKMRIHRTFWLTLNKERTNNKLKDVLQADQDNLKNTTGINFVVALDGSFDIFKYEILNPTKRLLNGNFENILWIFPQLNRRLEISLLFSFDEEVEVLNLQDKYTPTDGKNLAYTTLKSVVQTTIDTIKKYWIEKKYLMRTDKNSMHSLTFPEIPICNKQRLIDVIKMGRSEYFKEIIWGPIATWNGQTLQMCEMEKGKTVNAPPQIVFRVALVEHFPYVVKHKFPDSYHECPLGSKVCYGLSRLTNGETIINNNDRFCCTGLTIDILQHMSDRTSYKFELYFQEDALYGTYSKDNDSWNGVIKDILIGKADLALDLSLNPERCTYLDCSTGYIFSGANVITKVVTKKIEKRDTFASVLLSADVFFKPFDSSLLIAVFVAFNIFVILIWTTDKICLYYRNKRFEKNDQFLLLESMSFVWAIAFGRDVGDSKKPSTLSARYVSSWLAFLGLIFTNVYVARLMVEIVKKEVPLTFTSLKDPKVISGELPVGLLDASTTSVYFRNTRDSKLQELFNNNLRANLVPTFESGIDAVKNGSLSGFVADGLSLEIAVRQDVQCSLALIGNMFSVEPLGLIFRKNWPWSKEFKLNELEMNDRNISTRLHWRYLYSSTCERSATHAQLDMVDMSGLFVTIPIAIAYCVLCLFIENTAFRLIHCCRKSGKKLECTNTVDDVECDNRRT